MKNQLFALPSYFLLAIFLGCPSLAGLLAEDPDISGTYYRVNNGKHEGFTIHRVDPKTPGKFTGNLETEACTHEIEGTLESPTLYRIEIKRTQKQGSKGVTMMFGTLKQLSADKIHTHITSTDGKDDLKTDFPEHCDWAKSLKPPK